MGSIFNGGKTEQKNILSKDAAWNILSSIPSSILHPNLLLSGVDGTEYGYVTAETFQKLSGKKSATSVKVYDDEYLFHEKHRKDYKAEVRLSTMPEGAVVFPEDNFIIVVPANKNGKERAKFLKRLIGGYSGLTISDDAIMVKEGEDFYMVPVIDISTIPVLKWAVSPNSSKLKYAWVFEKLDEAVRKLHALEEVANAKAKAA